jgi:hypothetical protein
VRALTRASKRTDGLADALAELTRHPGRRHARGETARLEHDDLAVAAVEKRARNAGGLAGARRRLDDDGATFGELRDDGGE